MNIQSNTGVSTRGGGKSIDLVQDSPDFTRLQTRIILPFHQMSTMSKIAQRQ